MKTREKFSKEEVINFINRTAPKLGCGDFTYSPSFPEGHDDICLVTRAVENGYSYGYSIIYLVWKNLKGEMQKYELADTRSTKDNLYYKNLRVEGSNIKFDLEVSGTYSGNPSKKVVSFDISKL